MTGQFGQLLAAQNGYLFLYQSKLLQALDAAQAGGGGQVQQLNQSMIAETGISLKLPQKLKIDSIQVDGIFIHLM